jgi:predicted RNA-binding Zn ribbon-like protein
MVQRLLVGELDPWTADGRALLAGARFVLDEGGHVTDAEAGWRGFCRDLLPSLMALTAAAAPLRSCSNPACRLVFEDGSRNHGRRWCDTAGCGNRDRVRRARGRETVAAVS